MRRLCLLGRGDSEGLARQVSQELLIVRPYWTTAPIPTAEELKDGCREVAKMLQERQSGVTKKRAKQAARLLFALSRVGLPDVRANLFWPEVVREIRYRSGLDIPDADVPTLYRAWLSEAYADQIDWTTHHKYVALVFEQAGIGSGRDRIIQDFLRKLVEVLASRDADPEDKSRVPKALHDFEEEARTGNSEFATDISPLRTVLLRIGHAVEDFAVFIRGYPRKWMLATWEWDRVKELWTEASGVDPETLTPSARNVLQELVAWLATSASRHEVFSAIKEGTLKVQLPGSAVAQSVAHWMDLPIGPATLGGAFGHVTAELVDHPALTAAALLAGPRDEWLSQGEIRYRVSDSEFSGSLPDGSVRAAAPVFSGRDCEHAVRHAFYLASEVRPGWQPNLGAHPGGDRRAPGSRLHLEWTFYYDPEGLRLRIRRFKVLGISGKRQGLLNIGTANVWSGAIEDGMPVKWAPITVTVNAAHIQGARIELSYQDESGALHAIRLSVRGLWLPAFVAVQGRLIPEYSTCPVDPRQTPEANLYTEERSEVRCEGASLTPCGYVDFAGRRFARYAIGLFDGATTSVLRVRGREWRFLESVPFGTELDLPTERKLGEVTCSTTGNARIALQGDRVRMILRPASPWAGPPDYLRLHVGGVANLAVPVYPSTITAVDGRWMVDVSALFEIHSLVWRGETLLGIAAWDSVPESMFAIALADSASLLPCRFGERPSVVLDLRDRKCEAKARDVVTLYTLREGKHAVAHLDVGEERVWLNWRPRVQDVVLSDRAGGDCEYRLAAGQMEPGAITLESFGETWHANIAGASLVLEPGEAVDVSELVSAATSEGSSIVEIRCEGAGCSLLWRVIDSIDVERFEAVWEQASRGMHNLHVSGTIVGLTPNSIRIVARGRGQALDQREMAIPRHTSGTVERSEFEVTLPVPVSVATTQNLAIECEHHEIVARSISLQAAFSVVVPADGDLRPDIVEALKEFRASGSLVLAEYAIGLIARYVARSGSLPMEKARLLAPVMAARRGPHGVRKLMTDCVHLLADSGEIVMPEYRADDAPVLTMLLASLVVFQQAELAGRGLMYPPTLLEARNQLANLEEAGPMPWRTWCSAVAAFGRAVGGSADTARGRWRGEELPLTGLSEHFGKWLQEDEKVHEH